MKPSQLISHLKELGIISDVVEIATDDSWNISISESGLVLTPTKTAYLLNITEGTLQAEPHALVHDGHTSAEALVQADSALKAARVRAAEPVPASPINDTEKRVAAGLRNGATYQQLREKYNVSTGTIARIKRQTGC